jgi:hypothetical protein
VLAVNRRLAEQLSALEIYRSPEVRCDGPAPAEARERSLIASPPFPVASGPALPLPDALPNELHRIHRQAGAWRQLRFRPLGFC